MYHSLAVEDVLDLVNLCRANSKKLSAFQIKQLEDWQNIVPKMLYWLKAVSHPMKRSHFSMTLHLKLQLRIQKYFAILIAWGLNQINPKMA